MLARAGPDIDHTVRRTDRVLVVLDDNHGVSHIPEVLQRREQLVVVSLMEADARLIEDVRDADKSGADLCREADPLRLSAGEGRGRPAQRQVVEADVIQELHARADLLQNLVADCLLMLRELQPVQEFQELRHGQIRHLHDVLSADRDCERRRLEALSLADRTGRNPHELLVLRLRAVGVRLAVSPLCIFKETLKGDRVVARAALTLVVHGDLAAVRPVDQHFPDSGRKLSIRRVEAEAVLGCERLEQAVREALPVPGALPARDLDRPLIQRECPVRNDELRVEFHLVAEAGALRARAERIIE